MDSPKPFKTYAEQVALLSARGMHIDNEQWAVSQLERLNYYRLSGYWHTMRKYDADQQRSLNAFRPGASFRTVIDLHQFDERLRNCTFAQLSSIEVTFRAMLGYEMGKIDPLLHLLPAKLGPSARQRPKNNPSKTLHELWLKKFQDGQRYSREDFVKHHVDHYDGQLPIWAAVEVMDWGQLSHLFGMAPRPAQERIADRCQLTQPQLGSWLKTLNVLRNFSAHQSRLFNRTFDIKPKLPKDPRLDPAQASTNRIFGQLTLIQYLNQVLSVSDNTALPEILVSYPENELVPFTRLGAPENWRTLALWNSRPSITEN